MPTYCTSQEPYKSKLAVLAHARPYVSLMV